MAIKNHWEEDDDTGPKDSVIKTLRSRLAEAERDLRKCRKELRKWKRKKKQ